MSEDLLLKRIDVLEQHIPALAGLESLDKRFEKTDSKLDKLTGELHRFYLNSASSFGTIETRLSKIETSIKAKASAAEVSDIRGSMRSLPDVWQLIALVSGILGFLVSWGFWYSGWRFRHCPLRPPAFLTGVPLRGELA